MNSQDAHDAPDHPPAVIHVDLDGAADIYNVHGWSYDHDDDPIFESGLRRMLDLLAAEGLTATLFVIANALDEPRKLKLLREAVERGHEIASHSITHRHLGGLAPEERRQEIAESRRRLAEVLGVEVRGFRAPDCKMDRECLELLAESGYAWDSSAYPTPAFAAAMGVSVDSLRVPGRPLPGRDLVELPLPGYRPLPFPFHASYSHVLGLPYFRWGLSRYRRQNTPLVLLFHLIDVADPLPRDRLNGFKTRFFTLSGVSAAAKRERTRRILNLVRRGYRITDTSTLLAEDATS